MDKELIKKLVAQGKAYVLDLRGGSVPYKEGNAAAVDFYCPQDVVLNMPWVKMGRGHINLHLGIELPKMLVWIFVHVPALLTKVCKLMWPLLARTKHKLVT